MKAKKKDYTVNESMERGERVRQGSVAEPERNVEIKRRTNKRCGSFAHDG